MVLFQNSSVHADIKKKKKLNYKKNVILFIK